MQEDVYEALYQALNNPIVQPARRTFGKVEYAFIPVSVIADVLEDGLQDALDVDTVTPDDDRNDPEMGVEVAGPSPTEDKVDPTIGVSDTEPIGGTIGLAMPVFADDDANRTLNEESAIDNESEEE